MVAPSSLSRDNAFRTRKAIHSLREKFIEVVCEWRRRSGSRRDLLALSDRELLDIRLNRLDARREARKPFWKK